MLVARRVGEICSDFAAGVLELNITVFVQLSYHCDFSGFQETMPIALEALDEMAGEAQPFFLFVHGYD